VNKSGSARSILDMAASEWQRALGLRDDDIPVAIVSEGSWWREQRTAWRLSALDGVRELEFPDMFLGYRRGKPVVYCCAYGAPRAVEVAHIFGSLGTQLAVQIGTCGGLQGSLKPGDIVVPGVAVCREGIAEVYGFPDSVSASAVWSERARTMLEARDRVVHDGIHLTWYSLFAQDGEMVREWSDAGYLSVDMETATTFAVANRFGMAAVSMLVVWDELLAGRSFLDPLDPDAQRSLDQSNGDVFDVALEMVDAL